jgi:arsenate reductase
VYRKCRPKPDGGGHSAQVAGDHYIAYSAGTNPKGVDPRIIAVMNEIGCDISQQTSKGLDQFVDQQFDYVITLCDQAKERCPTFSGAAAIHWSFDDPAAAEGDRDAQLRHSVSRSSPAARCPHWCARNGLGSRVRIMRGMGHGYVPKFHCQLYPPSHDLEKQ